MTRALELVDICERLDNPQMSTKALSLFNIGERLVEQLVKLGILYKDSTWSAKADDKIFIRPSAPTYDITLTDDGLIEVERNGKPFKKAKKLEQIVRAIAKQEG